MLMTILAAAAVAPPATFVGPEQVECQRPEALRVDRRVAIGPRMLGAEPNAKQVLTVFRSVANCPQPVVLRDDIGGRPTPRAK